MPVKIKVPDEMFGAAMKAWNACPIAADGRRVAQWELEAALEAALRWLSENPIVPINHECCGEMHRTVNAKGYCCYQSALLAEWQRIMFREPEPEVPEAIRELMKNAGDCAPELMITVSVDDWDEAVLEAYKRGKASR